MLMLHDCVILTTTCVVIPPLLLIRSWRLSRGLVLPFEGTCLGLSEPKWPHLFAAIWTLRPTSEGQGVHKKPALLRVQQEGTLAASESSSLKIILQVAEPPVSEAAQHPPPPPPRWPHQACKLALWRRSV